MSGFFYSPLLKPLRARKYHLKRFNLVTPFFSVIFIALNHPYGSRQEDEMKHTVTGYKIQQSCSSSNITMESKIHDIKLVVNETIMLNFYSVCNEKSLKQSTRIAFNATQIGIISIHPSNILITKNLTQFATVFTSKKVGKTTVSLGQLIYIEIFSLLLNLCTFLYKNKMQHFGQLATEIAVLNQSQIFKKNDWLI